METSVGGRCRKVLVTGKWILVIPLCKLSVGFAIHRWILCIRSKSSRRDCRYRVHTLILDVPNDREEYVHVSRAFSVAGVSTGDVVG